MLHSPHAAIIGFAAICAGMGACEAQPHRAEQGMGQPLAAAAAQPCVTDDPLYVVCTARRDDHEIRMMLYQANGQPFGSVANFARLAEPPPLFAVNAGMYQQDLSPVGLYIERGRRLVPINRRAGNGNFYTQPNGVFLVDARGRGDIMPTAQWTDSVEAAYATQSGPMLVVDGRVNAALANATASKFIRNGVGVLPNGDIAFVISKQPVSLAAFADHLVSALKVSKALYLDGAVSSLAQQRSLLVGGFAPAGPIVAVWPRQSP